MSVDDKPTYNSKESKDSVNFFVAHVITADHLIVTAGEQWNQEGICHFIQYNYHDNLCQHTM